MPKRADLDEGCQDVRKKCYKCPDYSTCPICGRRACVRVMVGTRCRSCANKYEGRCFICDKVRRKTQLVEMQYDKKTTVLVCPNHKGVTSEKGVTTSA